jgi:hypothetical protein
MGPVEIIAILVPVALLIALVVWLIVRLSRR